MPATNLKITDGRLNSEMSELLLKLADLKEKFEGIGRGIGRGFKQGKPIPQSTIDSFTAFIEAVEDLEVDAARELLETLPNASELGLPDLRRAEKILGDARKILGERSVTGDGDAGGTLFDFIMKWIETREFPPLPGETLKRTLDEIVEKRAELRQRLRELETELDTDPLPLPPEKPDDVRIPGGPPGLPRRFLRNRQIRGDVGSGASELDGGATFERLGESLRLVSAAGREFDGAMRELDETGARVAATFEADSQSLDAFLDGLGQGTDDVDGFGKALDELKDIGGRAFAELQGVMGEFIRTGKIEWRGLASVAIDAIGDILAAQMKVAGASSSGGGGPLGAIGNILGTVFGSLLGTARPGFVASGGAPTPLQLSGPFEHGGSFVVGGSGATDGQLVSFLASPGERVDVLTPAQQTAGAAPTVNITQNFDFKGASLEAVALLRREANRIKHEVMAEILSSAQRGGAFARMPRI